MKEKTKALKREEDTARGGMNQGRRERTSKQETRCKNKGGTLELHSIEVCDNKYKDDNAACPRVLWMLSAMPSMFAWYLQEDKTEGTLIGTNLRTPERCCCVFRALREQMSQFGFIWEEPRL